MLVLRCRFTRGSSLWPSSAAKSFKRKTRLPDELPMGSVKSSQRTAPNWLNGPHSFVRDKLEALALDVVVRELREFSTKNRWKARAGSTPSNAMHRGHGGISWRRRSRNHENRIFEFHGFRRTP